MQDSKQARRSIEVVLRPRGLLIPLIATAIAQAGLAVVCFQRYPRARVPAAALACLAFCYLLFVTLGPGCLAALHRASSLDPVADWIDLVLQHIVLTGGIVAWVVLIHMQP